MSPTAPAVVVVYGLLLGWWLSRWASARRADRLAARWHAAMATELAQAHARFQARDWRDAVARTEREEYWRIVTDDPDHAWRELTRLAVEHGSGSYWPTDREGA